MRPNLVDGRLDLSFLRLPTTPVGANKAHQTRPHSINSTELRTALLGLALAPNKAGIIIKPRYKPLGSSFACMWRRSAAATQLGRWPQTFAPKPASASNRPLFAPINQAPL